MRSASTSAGNVGGCLLIVGVWLFGVSSAVQAQFFDPSSIMRPPADVPNAPPANNQSAPPSGGGTQAVPRGPSLQSAPPAASSSQAAPAGQALLLASARFGRDLPAIPSGLYWRVFSA